MLPRMPARREASRATRLAAASPRLRAKQPRHRFRLIFWRFLLCCWHNILSAQLITSTLSVKDRLILAKSRRPRSPSPLLSQNSFHVRRQTAARRFGTPPPPGSSSTRRGASGPPSPPHPSDLHPAAPLRGQTDGHKRLPDPHCSPKTQKKPLPATAGKTSARAESALLPAKARPSRLRHKDSRGREGIGSRGAGWEELLVSTASVKRDLGSPGLSIQHRGITPSPVPPGPG